MRHFHSQPVSQLAQRMHPSPTLAPLVALACDPLATPAGSSRALPTAVPSSRNVTYRAQRELPAAARIPTGNEVQREHGPRRRHARHPRGPVRPKMGRTATSRSRGAIEGTEGPAFVSSLCASTPRVHERETSRLLPSRHPRRRGDLHRDRRPAVSRSPLFFTAIRGDHLRRDQQRSRDQEAREGSEATPPDTTARSANS